MADIFRVENRGTMQGLWYDKDGTFNPFITKLTDAKSAHLPMGFDESYKTGGRAWYSGCEDLPQMKNWFTVQDLVELEQAGYYLYKFDAREFRQVPGHVVFTRESVVESVRLDLAVLKG